jgi:hypothetical protein
MDRLTVKRKLLEDLKGYASKGSAEDMAKRHGLTAKAPEPEPEGESETEEKAEGVPDEVDPAALEQLLAACDMPGEDEDAV